MIPLKRVRYTPIIFFIVLSLSLAAKNALAMTIHDGKAHYIMEVIKHITWPNEGNIPHFTVILLGHDDKLLNALINKSNISIRNKNILIEQVDLLSDIKMNPDMIIIHKNKLSLIAKIHNKYSNTLTVSDGATNKKGIMVGLLASKINIKLILNRENLVKHGFIISNSLLDFAGTKADLRKQLVDKESTLNDAIDSAKAKGEQLTRLNVLLTENQQKLQSIEFELISQNNQVIKAKSDLVSLKKDKEYILKELTNKKNAVLLQQNIIIKKEIEQQKQQQNLLALKLAIEQSEDKLQHQHFIIENKQQKINGQQKWLYITIAVALIILLLNFVVLRISNSRKAANDELAHLNEKLYELATRDDMTKLFNRRHFLALAPRELSQLLRNKNMGVVLMIDIDHFKKVNDNYGHAAGDQAIINVAGLLKSSIREYDIVGRVGGEEFAMFLPNSKLEVAMQVAERIRVEAENLSILFQESTIKLTVSIGLTAKTEHEKNIDDMLLRADKALYQAKSSGRNRVVLI